MRARFPLFKGQGGCHVKKVAVTLFFLVLYFGLACAEEFPFFGEINAKAINLRSDATISSTVISTLDNGQRVEVVSESYDWYKIRLPKELPVYIKRDLVTCIKHAESQIGAAPVVERCLSVKVLSDRVNIRAKPSMGAPIVGIADKNEVLNVGSESGGWYKIEPIQDSFAWVNKRFVDKIPAAVKVDKPAILPQSNTAPSQDNPDNLTVFTGIVEPYGVVFMRPATHKLVTGDNKTFLLKGNRASLNALNCQKVKVSGKINSDLKAKYPVIEVKIIEVAS